MNDIDYSHIIELSYQNGAFLPVNDAGRELAEQLADGQMLAFSEITARDLQFHRCYMGLLKYIRKQLPLSFQKQISEKHFYQFLKHLQKHYKTVYNFKDDAKRIEIFEYLKDKKKTDKKNYGRLTYKAINNISDYFGKLQLVEYESIAFGKMSQFQFETYVREQLPFIYSNVIGAFYADEKYDEIIADIEETFKKFLAKLK